MKRALGPSLEEYAAADELKALVTGRTGLSGMSLICPREKSFVTPCIARDGQLAVCAGGPDGPALCVGCERRVADLLAGERAKHGAGR